MWKEFKEFASKGNVLDLAIGVIIGGAFGKIVSSLVDDIIMPVIGVLTGGVDFTELHISVGEASLNYGVFIQNIIDFLIITLSIFMFIRTINKFKKKEEIKEEEGKKPEQSKEELLLIEIRDLLKERNLE